MSIIVTRGALEYENDVHAYRRTKVGDIRCKISSKKGGGHSVWAQKNESFLVWTPKNWGIQCAKMQFQAKICKFYVKIAAKLLHFSK